MVYSYTPIFKYFTQGLRELIAKFYARIYTRNMAHLHAETNLIIPNPNSADLALSQWR